MTNAADLESIEKEIISFSGAWSRAIVENDADKIGEFMGDEWIMVSEHGVMTRDFFLSLVRSGQLSHDAMDVAEFGGFNLYGKTAIFATRVTSIANFGGQRFESNEWTSDVFVDTSDGWKCVLTNVIPVLQKLE